MEQRMPGSLAGATSACAGTGGGLRGPASALAVPCPARRSLEVRVDGGDLGASDAGRADRLERGDVVALQQGGGKEGRGGKVCECVVAAAGRA